MEMPAWAVESSHAPADFLAHSTMCVRTPIVCLFTTSWLLFLYYQLFHVLLYVYTSMCKLCILVISIMSCCVIRWVTVGLVHKLSGRLSCSMKVHVDNYRHDLVTLTPPIENMCFVNNSLRTRSLLIMSVQCTNIYIIILSVRSSRKP